VKESQITRNISATFTTIPALLFAAFSLTTFRGEYFWLTYALMSVVFLTASALLGLFLPTRLQGSRLGRPWMWILVQGVLAWGLALLTLALLNMTPLCVGQDNGDGINKLTLCFVQTIGVAIASTPVAFTLLGLSALAGGAILDRRAAARLED
jgi:hypothetical protein